MIFADVKSHCRRVLTGLVLWTAVAGPASAADAQAITVADPEIPVDELELRLKPLTRAQLETEAQAWMAVLQESVERVTVLEIASKVKKAGLSEAENLEQMLEAVNEARLALDKAPDDEALQAAFDEAQAEFDQALADARATLDKIKTDETLAEAEKTVAEEEARQLEEAPADATETAVAPDATEPEAGPQLAPELLPLQKKITEFETEQTESRARLLAALTELREQQIAVTDRANLVIDAYEVKGGTVEEIEKYRQYITAVSGIQVELTDTEAVWSAATGWLTSKEGGLRWAQNLIAFVVTVLVFMLVASFAGKAVEKVLTRSKQASRLLSSFMATTVRRLVIAVGLIVGLAAMEVDIGPLLAVIGAAGFVIAFALQNSLGNFASGILILMFKPFDEGEMVEIGGVLGTVQSMNLLSVEIRTPDNKSVIIANNQVWSDAIINVTGTATRRVDLVFGIAYEDDIDKAQALMFDVVNAHEKILKRPEPIIRVHELADSSVNFVCRPWVRTDDYWDVYWDLTEQIKQRFDREGISIPFPQRDVHMIPAPAEVSAT